MKKKFVTLFMCLLAVTFLGTGAFAQNLRVLTWNIAEGGLGSLDQLAAEIRQQSPDIVLLNEVRNERDWPFGSGINEVVELSNRTGLPYRHWGNTNNLGLRGHKAVAILSRYPLGPAHLHPVMLNGQNSGFATLETTVTVNGMVHHVFSTRFAPLHPISSPAYDPDHAPGNRTGHQQAVNIVRNLDPRRPVIFGGDFNARPYLPQSVNFSTNSGLFDAFLRRPNPEVVADCVQLQGQINELIFRRNQLGEVLGGLDPRDPADREEIIIIQAEIAEINEQIRPIDQRQLDL